MIALVLCDIKTHIKLILYNFLFFIFIKYSIFSFRLDLNIILWNFYKDFEKFDL